MAGRASTMTKGPISSALFAALLMLVSALQVAVSFHHHDLDSHDDCPVCVAAHQGSLAPPAIESVVPVLLSGAESVIASVDLAVVSLPAPAFRSRGPPPLV